MRARQPQGAGGADERLEEVSKNFTKPEGPADVFCLRYGEFLDVDERDGGWEVWTDGLLKNSPRLADDAGVIAHVEGEVSDEAAGGAGFDPSAAGALIALVDALRGELGDSRASLVKGRRFR